MVACGKMNDRVRSLERSCQSVSGANIDGEQFNSHGIGFVIRLDRPRCVVPRIRKRRHKVRTDKAGAPRNNHLQFGAANTFR